MQLIRRYLQRQWGTYQLIAAMLRRLNASHQLSQRTQRRAKSLEATRGVGIYRVLCKLQKMIVSLDARAGNSTRAADWLCVDHREPADRIVSELTGTKAPRVRSIYGAAVLSVSVRQLLRRSAVDVACLQIMLGFLSSTV